MTVQNNKGATPGRGSGGVTGKGFKPGKSGNPGGRPKGLAAAVREKVPAEELTRWMLAIWNVDVDALAEFKIKPSEITLNDRVKAHEWLSERGYGKAPAFAPVEGGDPLELSDVDRAIAGIVDELAGRREAAPAGPSAPGTLADTG